MQKIIYFLALILTVCSCSDSVRTKVKVGVDSNWYPNNFGPQNVYVNGYTDEVLMDIAKHAKIEFEKIPANWDTLLEGLNQNKYDAIISSLPPLKFNMAKYDFSKPILNLSPVLVIKTFSKIEKMQDLNGQIVGIIMNDPSANSIYKFPQIIVRQFASVPDLLNAVQEEKIQAALLNQIPAARYVKDLYVKELKLLDVNLSNEALRFVFAKSHDRTVHLIDKTIDELQKTKRLESLQKQWGLN